MKRNGGAENGAPENVLISFNDKKAIYKMDYYISHTFLLVTIKIVTTCYYCIQIGNYHINNIK